MPAPHVGELTPQAVPVFRFAPSPNGRLHLGHAYSALLNADLARRCGGKLLLRIEDIDPVRSRPELVAAIHDDLAWLGLRFDGAALRQSERMGLYRERLDALIARELAYPCFCSRAAIAVRTAALEAEGRAPGRDPDGTPLYPGTCRDLSAAESARRREAGQPHTWRLDMAKALAAAPGPHRYEAFAPNPSPSAGEGDLRVSEGRERGAPPSQDRTVPTPLPDRIRGATSPAEGGGFMRTAAMTANPAAWGDAVIARRDVPTSYHLAVVLDDAEQGVTHVVRGQDLEGATDLHVLLQRLFGLPRPLYHHHALIRADDGQKLAKSRGSVSLADLRAHGTRASDVRTRLGF